MRTDWTKDVPGIDVAGQNLSARRHAKFGDASESPPLVPRSVYAKATLRY